ncbi:unnamed protein product [Caenorhabditis angaria]|uniref:MAM domain-containing protein n=1 Tax=Caenorhabditis angaria TaxID=860376 RepID=A0A9P1I8L1_9PELO|nr:unnamed protein product [Caenorhabditis angaria]
MWRFLLLGQFLYILARCQEDFCDFSRGICGWHLAEPWNVVGMAVFGGKPEVLKSDGPFLLAQGKFGGIRQSRAISSPIPKSKNLRIFAYKYQRKGDARLRIYLKKSGNFAETENHEMLLDTIIDEPQNSATWQRRSVVLPPILEEDTQIVFECSNIFTSADLIAIDDVEIATSSNNRKVLEREIRRKSPSSKCPLKCSFFSTSCQFHTVNTQNLPKKIVNENSGLATITSDFVVLPDKPIFLDFQIVDSAASQTTVTLSEKKFGAKKEIVWKNERVLRDVAGGGEGRRIRIPLKNSNSNSNFGAKNGIQIEIAMENPGNADFVAISEMDLVDENGESVECAASPSISPIISTSSTNRLTALQNLQFPLLEKLQYILRKSHLIGVLYSIAASMEIQNEENSWWSKFQDDLMDEGRPNQKLEIILKMCIIGTCFVCFTAFLGACALFLRKCFYRFGETKNVAIKCYP